MNKLSVAVIFGGISSEHEVSRVSASSVLNNLDKDKYDIHMIGITKSGKWLYYTGDINNLKDGTWEKDKNNLPACISPDRSVKGIYIFKSNEIETIKIDVVFPVLHGKYGEDGTIQGLFELAGLPYVGCNTTSSAVCMDKVFTKTVLDSANISQAKWLWFNKYDYNENKDKIIDQIDEKLGYPCFIKPANAGSSVGIGKAKNKQQLDEIIKNALIHDNRIVVEEGIDGIEVECAVLGNDKPIASVVGEIVPANEFYDYEAKYSSEDSLLYIPARLNENIMQSIRLTAVKAYCALGCEGMSRVDFFVRKNDNKILLNEVNTIPGFTSISMYPKLFNASGINYSELLNKLIELAIERAENR